VQAQKQTHLTILLVVESQSWDFIHKEEHNWVAQKQKLVNIMQFNCDIFAPNTSFPQVT
jgi:hypothetical protein